MWMLPVGMAALGAIQGENKRQKEKAMNLAAAEQTRYSPWTGMGLGQLQNSGSGALGGALQGGLSGAMMAQSFGGFGGDSTAVDPNAHLKTGMNASRNGNLIGDNEQLLKMINQSSWG